MQKALCPKELREGLSDDEQVKEGKQWFESAAQRQWSDFEVYSRAKKKSELLLGALHSEIIRGIVLFFEHQIHPPESSGSSSVSIRKLTGDEIKQLVGVTPPQILKTVVPIPRCYKRMTDEEIKEWGGARGKVMDGNGSWGMYKLMATYEEMELTLHQGDSRAYKYDSTASDTKKISLFYYDPPWAINPKLYYDQRPATVQDVSDVSFSDSLTIT